jgi:hypothetical protein
MTYYARTVPRWAWIMIVIAIVAALSIVLFFLVILPFIAEAVA